MIEIQRQVANIQQSAQTDPRFKQYDEVTVTSEAKEYTNRIFKSLLPHFPAWRQSCPEPDDLGRMKNAWTKAIMRHELKVGKKLNVKAGLLACEESDTDWLWSVGKFIKMCDQSNEVLPLAQRALDLFNSAQKQIDNVGQMVVSKHAFSLKQMKAAETNKQFIELYLSYAENNPIEGLEAFALTETVQLNPEQLKDKQKRTQAAQNDFFKLFKNCKVKSGEDVRFKGAKEMKVQTGIKKGSTGIKAKTPKQLDAIKGKM
jgi:hypothetical protein